MYTALNQSFQNCVMKSIIKHSMSNQNNLHKIFVQINILVDFWYRCFQVFKIIHQLTDSEKSIYIATVDVIKEFAKENVRYLELRTTPRVIDGSIDTYVNAVIKGIE